MMKTATIISAILVSLQVAPCFAEPLGDFAQRHSLRNVEALLIEKDPKVERQDGKLIIRTSKNPVVFQDRHGGESSKQSWLIDHFDVRVSPKRRDYVVMEKYHEGQAFVLINGLSGQQIRLAGAPILSRSKRHYASAFHHSGRTGLQILKMWDYSEVFSWRPAEHIPGMNGTAECVWETTSSLVVFEYLLKTSSQRPLRFKSEKGKWSGPHHLEYERPGTSVTE